jgi:hypothetical protein
MRVACVYGDVYLPRLQPEYWNEGNVRKCWLASRTTPRPNNAKDLLLCGDTAKQAWGLTWLREDIKKSLYDASAQRQVTGHGGSRIESEWWACKNTAAGLECY